MKSENLRYFLALWLIHGIGLAAQKLIVQQFLDLQEFFTLSHMDLKKLGCSETIITQLRAPDWKQVDTFLTWSLQPNHRLLTYWDPDYPFLLNETQNAPTILFADGNIETLDYSQLAIVGSRNPTQAGQRAAKQSAAFLAEQGLSIISGMASGIDAIAHQSALDVGGKTIAVLGTGVDVVYPKENQNLSHRIREHGLLISEFPLGTLAQKDHFPRRNRIISGLAVGTFIVEAALKSGSLITARYALEQGREVFAMPSSVHNPMGKGCHWLIKQGASLIESAHDIWQEIQQFPLKLNKNQAVIAKSLDFTAKQPYIKNHLNQKQQELLDLISFDIVSIEVLARQTELKVEILSVLLLELEVLGMIEAVPGGYQRIVIK